MKASDSLLWTESGPERAGAGTQRYTVMARADEDAPIRAITALAAQPGRHGCGRVTHLLNGTDWDVPANIRIAMV